MKNPLFSIALSLLTLSTFAQSPVTFTLVTAPCDSDGVMAISYTGTGPFDVTWFGGTTYGMTTHSGLSGLTDTLRHYNGGFLSVQVSNSTTSVTLDTGRFHGAPPFRFAFSSTPGVGSGMGTASVTVIGGTPPYSYYWFSGPYISLYVGSGNPISVPAGIYGVAVTDAAGCWYSSSIDADTLDTVRTTTFVAQLPHNQTSLFSVYPNPASNIIFMNTRCANGTAEIQDIFGKVYLHKNITCPVTPFDIHTVPRGIYLVIWNDGDGHRSAQKVMIE